MGNLELDLDGDKLQLEEVACNENGTLYRFASDWRVVGAPLKDIKELFPEYKFEPNELVAYDFLFEKDGVLQFYWPDGEPITDDELEELEEL